MSKVYDTNKLFYNKFAYKVDLLFPLGHIFREKKWKWVRTVLDSHKTGNYRQASTFFKYNNHPDEDFNTAERIYKLLQTFDDEYMIRVESPRLIFYTSNHSYVESLLQQFPSLIKAMWEPSNDYILEKLLSEKHIIIDDDSEWDFAIHLTRGIEVDKRLSRLKEKGNIYFRNKRIVQVIKVKNNKSLTLVQLLLENRIKRIYTIERGKQHES